MNWSAGGERKDRESERKWHEFQLVVASYKNNHVTKGTCRLDTPLLLPLLASSSTTQSLPLYTSIDRSERQLIWAQIRVHSSLARVARLVMAKVVTRRTR